MAKNMAVNGLVLLLNALRAVSPQRNGCIVGLPGIAIGVNRSQTGGGVPCTHLTICDILREILLRQVAEVCRNRVARRGQHILIRKHILICANRAEHLDTVNRRCFHLRLVDRQCSRDRAIIHRTARVRYRQIVNTAVRLVLRRVGRDGIRHGGRLNAVRNARRCRDDQLLQIIAVDLGGMIVLINGHGLRAEPEGDFPVAEYRIIRKVFQRDLVFSAIVPMAHQSDIDIRCRQHRHILRRRSFPCRRRGILKQTDSTNRQCNGLACCVCRKACRQLERTAGHTGAVRLCAVQLRVPLSLSLLVRDKAQIRQHLLAVNEHPALIVQRAVVVRDGDVEGTVIVLPERNVKGVVQCTGCRLAVLHIAVIGADVLVKQLAVLIKQAIHSVDIRPQPRLIVACRLRNRSIGRRIRHNKQNTSGDFTRSTNDTIIVNRCVVVCHVVVQLIIVRIHRIQIRTCNRRKGLILPFAFDTQIAEGNHTRIRLARFTSITILKRISYIVCQTPGIIKIIVVSHIIFIRYQAKIISKSSNRPILVCILADGKTILYVGIACGNFRTAALAIALVAITHNACRIRITHQLFRIVAAAINVQHNIFGRNTDGIPCIVIAFR